MSWGATQIQMQLIERSILTPYLGVIALAVLVIGHLANFVHCDPVSLW